MLYMPHTARLTADHGLGSRNAGFGRREGTAEEVVWVATAKEGITEAFWRSRD